MLAAGRVAGVGRVAGAGRGAVVGRCEGPGREVVGAVRVVPTTRLRLLPPSLLSISHVSPANVAGLRSVLLNA